EQGEGAPDKRSWRVRGAGRFAAGMLHGGPSGCWHPVSPEPHSAAGRSVGSRAAFNSSDPQDRSRVGREEEAPDKGLQSANAVEVIYEGEEEAVLGFEDDVRRLAPEGAEVEGLEFWDYDGPVPDIERFRSHFATLQLGKIIEVGLAMIRRQDETIAEIRAFREESSSNQRAMLEKQDLMLRKQDETIAEIRALRDAVTELLDERLRKLEEDVREIKARLGLI
ncbi:MAG: hypothetical protein QI223_06385, partial [Candidatus Korarchaeota archaeon]|nr:hypothetical protein [Candidatus Korarchaeota archaeon]